MTRGGKRMGAGRKPGSGKYGEKTVALRLPESMVDDVLTYVEAKGFQLPLYESRVQAGFPSPADDSIETRLNVNDLLVRRPAATFFVRVQGNSMLGAGMHEGDLLVVDRALPAMHGKIVIAAVNGELTVKRLQYKRQADGTQLTVLHAENPEFRDLVITQEMEFSIWGVVTNVIHPV